MDKVVQEYKKLMTQGFVCTGKYFTVLCGCRYWSNDERMCWFGMNYRNWDAYTVYEKIGCPGERDVLLPKHYFYTKLILELSYKGRDILFWIWVLQHYLPIKELRLKIIYWLFIIVDEDGQGVAGI